MPRRLAAFLLVTVTLGFFAAHRITRRPEKHDGRTVVTYMTWGDPEQRNLEVEMARIFMEQNPDIEVRVAHVPNSAYIMKQNIMLASDSAPDVMRIDQYFFPALVKKGYFQQLEPLMRKRDPQMDAAAYAGRFAPLALEECRYDGKLYAMNMLYGARAIYFNKTMFDEAGIPDPYTQWKQGTWTADSFLDVCRKLSRKDEHGRSLTYGVGMRESFWPLFMMMGGKSLNEKMDKAFFDSPESIAALEFQARLFREKLAPSKELEGDPMFAFESNRLAMNITWAGESVHLRRANVAFDWDIAPLPEGPGGRVTTAKGNQLVISRSCKHPVEAWRWIEFLVSEAGERRLYVEARRGVPTQRCLMTEYSKGDDRPPHHPNVFADSVIRFGRRLPINERWFEWEYAMTSHLDGLWLGSKTSAQAAAEIQRDVTEILTRNDY